MSINKRQFDLLQAMGITVWQRRDLSSHNSLSENPSHMAQNSKQDSTAINAVATEPSAVESQNTITHITANEEIAVDLQALLKQQLFKDVIRCLGAISADLSVEHNQIDLGIINWQFTVRKSIEFKHNCLKTPDLITIANSPSLKKSLWQSIGSLSSI